MIKLFYLHKIHHSLFNITDLGYHGNEMLRCGWEKQIEFASWMDYWRCWGFYSYVESETKQFVQFNYERCIFIVFHNESCQNCIIGSQYVKKKMERKKIELLSTIKEWKKRTIQIKCIPPLWKERKVAYSNPKLLVKFNFTIPIKQNEDPNSHTTNSNNNMYMMLPTMFTDDLSLYTLMK